MKRTLFVVALTLSSFALGWIGASLRWRHQASEQPFRIENQQEEPTSGPMADPFQGNGYGLILKDPNDVTQRHMCIALWYGSFDEETFGRAVGHKFGPVWNKRHPVEILEEHLAFMKEFMATTERLEREEALREKK